ncbi:hypothetical protein EDD16DRAFT_1528978 [Pisolithus croceorrhizus]|nr:hypothetical protein EDD16DRAFT_1528978 [Pisolithus croceorrhizus]
MHLTAWVACSGCQGLLLVEYCQPTRAWKCPEGDASGKLNIQAVRGHLLRTCDEESPWITVANWAKVRYNTDRTSIPSTPHNWLMITQVCFYFLVQETHNTFLCVLLDRLHSHPCVGVSLMISGKNRQSLFSCHNTWYSGTIKHRKCACWEVFIGCATVPRDISPLTLEMVLLIVHYLTAQISKLSFMPEAAEKIMVAVCCKTIQLASPHPPKSG